ncbi:OprD family outer membrane porin [Pseudomonas sp. NPDC090592]|uniref:OprD family outer membrane porin n=1 Tax=Pseudomonas sp. NPDC090592 TaxID=3364480 RepID=UPI00383AD664
MRTSQMISIGTLLISSCSWAGPSKPNPNETAQSQAPGLIEGQSLNASITQYFIQDDAKRNTFYPVPKEGGRYIEHQDKTQGWLQGNIINYTSGYTQGDVGFAFEVAGYNEIALSRGHGTLAGGGDRTLRDSEGDAVGQWSKLGLANLKLRASNTVLTLGRQNMATPQVATNSSTRALPSSFSGLSLRSTELKGMAIDLATFDRALPRTEQSTSRFFSDSGIKSVSSDRVSTAGVSWGYDSEELKLYSTTLEDFWRQDYLNIIHRSQFSDALGINTSLNFYRTREQGDAKLASIDNNAYSLAITLNYLGHSLLGSWQHIDGNEPFDYIRETNGSLLTSTSKADFNGPNETSLKLAYTLDSAMHGLPGLKTTLYVTRGWGVDGTHYQGEGYTSYLNVKDARQAESGVLLTYVVQSGRFANSMGLANFLVHRSTGNHPAGNFNELRFMLRMPFKLL